jgi:hypothetical protein
VACTDNARTPMPTIKAEQVFMPSLSAAQENTPLAFRQLDSSAAIFAHPKLHSRLLAHDRQDNPHVQTTSWTEYLKSVQFVIR